MWLVELRDARDFLFYRWRVGPFMLNEMCPFGFILFSFIIGVVFALACSGFFFHVQVQFPRHCV